jgi:hypothetical protein
MPLRLRLTLLFAAATAAIIAVAGSAFVLQLNDSLDDALDTAIDAKLDALSDRVGASGAGSARSDDGEEPVQVLTASGALVRADPPTLPRLLDDAQLRALLEGPQRVLTDRPVDSPLRRSTHFTRMVGDDRMRIGAAVAPSGHILVIGIDTEITDGAADRIEKAMLIGGPPAVIAAGLGAWILSGAALRPVARMSRQAAEISAHDADTTLAVPSTNDEIAILARTMNDLLGRLRDALAGERRFVADASHELRTPLATLSAELELAERPGRSPDDLREAIQAARLDTARLSKLASDLLLLARAQADQPLLRRTEVDLRDLLDDAATAANLRATARDGAPEADQVIVRSTLPDGIRLTADPDRLRQVLDNVLENAARHDPDGTIELTAGGPSAGSVRIAVRDHGPGFPPEFLPHAFERFRRADCARARSDGGTGLGLTIAAAIVHAHRGTITAANHPGGGAELAITLPLA